jgi:hypothetical protein
MATTAPCQLKDSSSEDMSPPSIKRRKLLRRTTEDGRNYAQYTYLGGNTTHSLPLKDRCKLVKAMLQDVSLPMLYSLRGA